MAKLKIEDFTEGVIFSVKSNHTVRSNGVENVVETTRQYVVINNINDECIIVDGWNNGYTNSEGRFTLPYLQNLCNQGRLLF